MDEELIVARALWDENEGRWVSDAQVAEVTFTAFTSRRRSSAYITLSLVAESLLARQVFAGALAA